jgi:hypothetical protein
MARKQRDIVSYFPHDADASTRNDTLIVLQSRFGNDGYAFWFKLRENLASTDGHFIDCRNSNTWQLLLARTGVNEITGVEIMKLLVEMRAIDSELWDSKLIWCQELVDDLAEVYKNRRRQTPRKPIITGNNGITTGKKGITTGDNPQSRVDKSRKEKEIYKEKEREIFNYWNQQNIIVHQKLVNDVRSVIVRTLRSYSVEEVKSAISNYSAIVHGEEYFFNYKWTLKDFLKRGLEKFMDLEVAKSNFRKEGRDSGMARPRLSTDEEIEKSIQEAYK